MRIVLSGGGTGGHLTPVLAVARQLCKLAPQSELHFIGQGEELTDQLSGLATQSHTIAAGKWRRYHNQGWLRHLLDIKTTGLNLVDVFKFSLGFAQSLFWLLRSQPDVVFTKGGFVSLPVGLSAALLKKPLIIHESDVTPGLSNRILARFADTIATGWPTELYPQWASKEVINAGNPIRRELLRAKRAQGIELFDIDPQVPVLLVLGGSTGARAINDAVLSQAATLTERCQVLHVVGSRDFDRVNARKRQLQLKHTERYQIFEFLTDKLGPAFRAADVVVTRAGANFLAELAAFEKPTIVVPSPYLAGGHQLRNAAILKEAGAVVELSQDRLDDLASTVGELMQSQQQRETLARRFSKFAQLDADQKLAKKIIQLGAGE